MLPLIALMTFIIITAMFQDCPIYCTGTSSILPLLRLSLGLVSICLRSVFIRPLRDLEYFGIFEAVLLTQVPLIITVFEPCATQSSKFAA